MALLGESELRERVARLAAIERPSASRGEHRAAELIAAELRETGADARLEEERAHGTYWWPLGIAAALGALSGVGGRRRVIGLLALTAAAAVYDELRIGPRAMRRILPRRTTTNVVAEIGPRDAGRTVVFLAHHDAAHAGIVFHPELPRAVARRFPKLFRRMNTTPPTMWPAFAGPLLAGVGALVGSGPVRRLGALLSAGFAVAMLDIGLRPVVPGANDNLSGVAVLLSLAHALGRDAPDGLRVMLVSTGSEESFMEGMEGFARRHFQLLPRERTWFVCLDTVGSPHLLLLEGEGMLGVREYRKQFLELIDGCAEKLGIFVWPGLRFRNATDALLALKAGYPAAMLGSGDGYKFPTHYHWPTDTPDNVHYGTVADAARLCLAVAERLAADRGKGSPVNSLR
jgi:hypothetical protein